MWLIINVYELVIDFGKPKSVASFIYLAVVNNYTVIQYVKQILDDFVVLAVSKIAPENVGNLKCYFANADFAVLFSAVALPVLYQ